MNKTTRVLSLATVMIAMTGMMGISFDTAFATGNGAGGVGKGGYQLNLVGQDRSTDAICDNNGHRIFVPLYGPFKIKLSEGDFEVLDCSALDKDKTAEFQLPDPTPDGQYVECLDIDGLLCDLYYSVHIRVLGTPGKALKINPTCAEADLDGDGVNEEYCSTDNPIWVENANGKKGGAKFQDVSKELLTLCVNTDGIEGCDERIALFDDEWEGFLWSFGQEEDDDNDISNNPRLTQLRFIINEQPVE